MNATVDTNINTQNDNPKMAARPFAKSTVCFALAAVVMGLSACASTGSSTSSSPSAGGTRPATSSMASTTPSIENAMRTMASALKSANASTDMPTFLSQMALFESAMHGAMKAPYTGSAERKALYYKGLAALQTTLTDAASLKSTDLATAKMVIPKLAAIRDQYHPMVR